MGCNSSIHCQLEYNTSNIFQFENIIGKGGYSVVRSAKYLPTGKYVAIKQQALNKESLALATKELEILKRIHHPCVIHPCYAYRDSNYSYIVYDFLSGGDLRHNLNSIELFSESAVAYIISSIGSALMYLHQKKILHRDVKLDNIVLNAKGDPYLTDFGISFMQEDSILPICQEASGTTQYAAPEVLAGGHHHSVQADYWSLGIVCYELLFGKEPFPKTCPKHYIYYSEKRYSHLWEVLKRMNLDQSGEPALQYFNLNEILFSFPNNEIFIGEELNSKMVLSQSQVDLINSIDSTSVEDKLPINFHTPIPTTARCGEISTGCRDFLQQILDVRLNHRLGSHPTDLNLSFSNHKWFREQEISFDEHRIICPKSLDVYMPDVDLIALQIYSRYPENLIVQDNFREGLLAESKESLVNDLTQSDESFLKNFINIVPDAATHHSNAVSIEESHFYNPHHFSISATQRESVKKPSVRLLKRFATM